MTRKTPAEDAAPSSPVYEAHSEFAASLGAPNRGVYRRTPVGEPTVKDLVRTGMEIKTSYNTGGIVLCVSGPYAFTGDDDENFEHYTIVYVPAAKWGSHKPSDHRWINECVAVAGQILMLFEANTDEVSIINSTPQFAVNRRGQLSLL